MTNRTAHKPSEASRKYTIHGARDQSNDTLNDVDRPRRSSQAEARKSALEYDLKRRLERIVQDVQEASR